MPWILMLSLIIHLYGAQKGEAILAYDCSQTYPPGTYYYSMEQTDNCKKRAPGKLSSKDVHGLLLELIKKTTHNVQKCTVLSISRRLNCENNTSITPLEWETQEHISGSQCLQLVETGVVVYEGHTIHLKETPQVILRSSKQLLKDGGCNKSVMEKTFNISVLTTQINILRDNNGNVEEIMDLNGEVYTAFYDNYAVSNAGGVILLPKHTRSEGAVERLYEGPAVVVKYFDDVEILYIPDTNSAMEIYSNELNLLGYPVKKTSNPYIYWFPGENFPISLGGPVNSANLNYVITGLTSYQIKNDIQHEAALLYTYKGLCRLEQKMRDLAYKFQSLSNENFALLLLGSRGYSAQVSGDTISVYPCRATEFKFKPRSTCFDKVPIQINGSKVPAYLNSETHTIHWEASSMDCNDPELPVIRLGKDFIKFSPDRTIVSGKALPSLIEIPILQTSFSHRKHEAQLMDVVDRRATHQGILLKPLSSWTEMPVLDSKFSSRKLNDHAIISPKLDRPTYSDKKKETQLMVGVDRRTMLQKISLRHLLWIEPPVLSSKFYGRRIYDSLIHSQLNKRPFSSNEYIPQPRFPTRIEEVHPTIESFSLVKRTTHQITSDNLQYILTTTVTFIWLITLSIAVLYKIGFRPFHNCVRSCCSKNRKDLKDVEAYPKSEPVGLSSIAPTSQENHYSIVL
ncbi:unnamed protein product [Lepeophtheirus salmonis]|uniref:(salmon louse) hypothetical protein n=1 Tax=Lepeophtheirus salmonis TaxID=72036 RepID=A0A0K2UMR8_LEPSM|nr:unnamed protein product [Lepeophtheirus salmonis]CAF3041295.1 unnamed protein product [Lepeophtheirus salmonis]